MDVVFTADVTNAAIETIGGLFIWLHVRQILKDRTFTGASVWPLLFFTMWGIFNLIYYPIVGQWISGLAAIGPAIANLVWMSLIFYYIRNPSPPAAREPV